MITLNDIQVLDGNPQGHGLYSTTVDILSMGLAE